MDEIDEKISKKKTKLQAAENELKALEKRKVEEEKAEKEESERKAHEAQKAKLKK